MHSGCPVRASPRVTEPGPCLSGFSLGYRVYGFMGLDRFAWGAPTRVPKTTPALSVHIFQLFFGVPATPNDPQMSAHHKHQRVGPRVSEAAGSRNRRKYRGFHAVMEISVLKPPYAPRSHPCLEAGAPFVPDARLGEEGASFLLGDPGSEHQ